MNELMLNQSQKYRHPFYKIMDLKEKELLVLLKTWERNELIDWLCWNDSNGIYRDQDSLREFGTLLDKEEAIRIIINQIHINS